MACQQIRRESGELPYTINTFSFSDSSTFSNHTNLAGRFLESIGYRNTLAMRSILFDLDIIHSVYESATDLTLMRDFANSKLQIDFRYIGFLSLLNPPYAHKLDLDIRNLTASFANQRRPIRTHFKEVERPVEQADPENATGEWKNMYRLDQEFADAMVIWSRPEEQLPRLVTRSLYAYSVTAHQVQRNRPKKGRAIPLTKDTQYAARNPASDGENIAWRRGQSLRGLSNVPALAKDTVILNCRVTAEGDNGGAGAEQRRICRTFEETVLVESHFGLGRWGADVEGWECRG
ncbi:hypothetical protein LTS10_012528 [Elasticomyces elasticus]|nr:hypothetical protein LTS10_012528 [Elasticomyces elasticus]